MEVDIQIVEMLSVEKSESNAGDVCQERDEVVETISAGQKTTGQQLVELVLELSPPLHISGLEVLLPDLTPGFSTPCQGLF